MADKYRAGSEECYQRDHEAHAAGGRATPDRGAYLPSPAQILERRTMLHWLRGQGFSNHFIASIMLHDTPTYETVRRMVNRYGPAEAARRCHPFTVDTEYGKSSEPYRPGTRVPRAPQPGQPGQDGPGPGPWGLGGDLGGDA